MVLGGSAQLHRLLERRELSRRQALFGRRFGKNRDMALMCLSQKKSDMVFKCKIVMRCGQGLSPDQYVSFVYV